MMTAQMASARRAMADLERKFRTNTGKAFVLVEGYEEKREYLPRGYDPHGITSMWQYQMKFKQETMSEAGLRQYVNPPARHVLPQFRGSKGTNSSRIVGDANLRHLLLCSKQVDVDAALEELNDFRPNVQVAITNELSIQHILDSFAGQLKIFFNKLPALSKFGDLRLVYTTRRSNIDFLYFRNWNSPHRIPSSTVRTDGLFSVLFRSNNQQGVANYGAFGLLSLELKATQLRATAGIPLSGHCRPGTNDARGVQTVRDESGGDDHREQNACDNFQHTVNQAFQGAVMSKCELLGTMDGAGMSLFHMNRNMVGGLDEALAAVRRDALDQTLEMTVEYDQAHCVYWEEGTFWKDLTCAIVNQLFAQFPELWDFLELYSQVERRREHQQVLDRYRNISRDINAHRLSHSLYEQCGEYFNITSQARGHAVLEPFGEFVEHGWEEYQILETFHESGDDIATSVYKVSHPAINNHQPFVAKLHNFDNAGEHLFLNELKVYHRLMSQHADPRIWPLLLEFGLVFMNGAPYYYLAVEHLDGEIPIEQECRKCANELIKYGIYHGDIKPSNFFKVISGSRKIVKAIDFGISTMLPEARDSTKATNIME